MLKKLILALGCIILASVANASIFVNETFEAPGGGCGVTGGNGFVNDGGLLVIDGSNPHAGSCSARANYASNEQIRRYGTDHALGGKVIHTVYWQYFSSAGSWCRHQKMNRFFIGTTPLDWSGNTFMMAWHPYGNGVTARNSNGSVHQPPLQPTCPMSDAPGCDCAYIDVAHNFPVDTWTKVEIYAELKGTCEVQDTCTGCSDIFKVWVNDTLTINRHNFHFSENQPSWTWQEMWFFGNDSNDNSSTQPPFKTVWMDDICVATTAAECGGQAAGGQPTDTLAPDTITTLSIGATTPTSAVLQWTAPADR